MASVRTVPAPTQPAIPPLENGDRLTRAEFERRYHAMPDVKKAELIEGVVHMPSPVRLKQHGEPHLDLVGVLWTYRSFTPGIRGGDNTTLRLDMDNDHQPDAVLFIDPACGGQAKIDAEGYLAGAPELAAEVASSSASIDLGSKFTVYRRNGVKEYVVWRVLDEAIDWFVLRDGRFELLSSQAGVFKSEVFPGFWLDAQALVTGDLPRIHRVLQEGVQSPEHALFVASLQK